MDEHDFTEQELAHTRAILRRAFIQVEIHEAIDRCIELDLALEREWGRIHRLVRERDEQEDDLRRS